MEGSRTGGGVCVLPEPTCVPAQGLLIVARTPLRPPHPPSPPPANLQQTLPPTTSNTNTHTLVPVLHSHGRKVVCHEEWRERLGGRGQRVRHLVQAHPLHQAQELGVSRGGGVRGEWRVSECANPQAHPPTAAGTPTCSATCAVSSSTPLPTPSKKLRRKGSRKTVSCSCARAGRQGTRAWSAAAAARLGRRSPPHGPPPLTAQGPGRRGGGGGAPRGVPPPSQRARASLPPARPGPGPPPWPQSRREVQPRGA